MNYLCVQCLGHWLAHGSHSASLSNKCLDKNAAIIEIIQEVIQIQ